MLRRRQPEYTYAPEPDYVTGFETVDDNRPNRNSSRSTRLAATVLALSAVTAISSIASAISKPEGPTSTIPAVAGPQVAGEGLSEPSGDCSDCVYPGPNNRYGTTWVSGASVVYGEGAWVDIRAYRNGKPYSGVLAVRTSIAPGTTEFVSPETEHHRPTNEYQTKLPIGTDPAQFAMARSPSSSEVVIGTFSQTQSVDVTLGAPNFITVDVPASLAS